MINEKIKYFEDTYLGVNESFLEKISAMDQQTLKKQLCFQESFLESFKDDLRNNVKASSEIREADEDFASYLLALLESNYNSTLDKILSSVYKIIVIKELLQDEE